MFFAGMKEWSTLRSASRLTGLSSATGAATIADVLLLVGCGGLAALATGWLHPNWRVPGHAILRGMVPLAFGIAVVPRVGAGSMMALVAGLLSAAFHGLGWGRMPIAAVAGLFLLGPTLDLALRGSATGWRLYARFVAAGLVANLLAFGARWAIAYLALDASDGRGFLRFWPTALVSFAACGALTGLLSAMLWFRWSPQEAGRGAPG